MAKEHGVQPLGCWTSAVGLSDRPSSLKAELHAPLQRRKRHDGSLSNIRIVKADDGAMVFNNNTEVVVYAIFIDEISDDPDTPGVASQATVNAAIAALQNAGKEVATEYNP